MMVKRKGRGGDIHRKEKVEEEIFTEKKKSCVNEFEVGQLCQ